MNALHLTITYAAASIIAVSSASALGPVTNWSSGTSVTNQFNTNAYGPSGGSLDGTPLAAPIADQWQTTDPFNGVSGSTSVPCGGRCGGD
jgi:hypothetical protein